MCQQMTPAAKEIPNAPMYRQESLHVSGGLEPPHLSLALAGRLMRDFCSIVFGLSTDVNTQGITLPWAAE
jgi:hypothetical protein